MRDVAKQLFLISLLNYSLPDTIFFTWGAAIMLSPPLLLLLHSSLIFIDYDSLADKKLIGIIDLIIIVVLLFIMQDFLQEFLTFANGYNNMV